MSGYTYDFMILKMRVFGTDGKEKAIENHPRREFRIRKGLINGLRNSLAGGNMEIARESMGTLGDQIRTTGDTLLASKVAVALETHGMSDPAHVKPVLKSVLIRGGISAYRPIKVGIPELIPGIYAAKGILDVIIGQAVLYGALLAAIAGAITYGIYKLRSRMKQIEIKPGEAELLTRMFDPYSGYREEQQRMMSMGTRTHFNRRDL